MTVWSVSPFMNELDVLEIRLATLDPHVDVFVLAEATVTQRGQPKPLHLDFALRSGRFDRWRDKIRVVTVEDMPMGQDHWEREHFQRNALRRAMWDLAETDAVLVCDLDEIPYPDALTEALADLPVPTRFPMDMFVYRLNWRWRERPVTDGSTAVVQPGHVFWDQAGRERPVHEVLLGLPADWRAQAGRLVSSGWHLAYMGSTDQIRAKTLAIADDAWKQLIPEDKKTLPGFWEQFATPDGTVWRSPTGAHVLRCITTGMDVFGRDDRQAEWVDVDQLPPYVAEDPDRLAHLLVPDPRSFTPA